MDEEYLKQVREYVEATVKKAEADHTGVVLTFAYIGAYLEICRRAEESRQLQNEVQDLRSACKFYRGVIEQLRTAATKALNP